MTRALILFLVALACPHGARADTARAHLSWQAPEGCTTLDVLKDRLGLLVKRPVLWVAESDGSRFSIEVVAEPMQARWRARITLRDASGRVLGMRGVESRFEQCSELNVPVVLVIATLVDGLWDELEAASAPAAEPTSPREATRRGALGAFWGATYGLGGGSWWSLGLRLDVPGPWPIALDARVNPPAADVDARGRGARLGVALAGLSVCPSLWTGPWRQALSLCAGVQAGVVWGSGIQLTAERSRTLPMAYFELGPAWSLPLGSAILLRISLNGGLVFVRPQFEWSVAGGRITAQSERFLLGAQISLMGRLP